MTNLFNFIKEIKNMENKWKNKNFFVSLKNSFNGIKYVFITQRNLKIQFLFAILATILGCILKISLVEWSIIVLLIFMVFLSEIFNTAIETVVDMITIEYNEKAKTAKDISAGGVTLVAISSVIIGILIFLPKIII